MLKRYAIWDKKTAILTPIGEILTAEQWIDRYPMAGLDSITVVCGAGEINGSYFGTLGQMVQMYESQGADFSNAETPEEKLEVIEAWEDAQNTPDPNYVSNEELSATALQSIAASMEFQNMMMLPDEEFEDTEETIEKEPIEEVE